MNKILPIILVVVLSGCGFSYVNHINSKNNLKELLDARHKCTSELGGALSCSTLRNCLRKEGWIRIESTDGVVVPPEYRIKCK